MKVEYIKHTITDVISIKKIVTIHYYEFDKDFRFEGESHDFWEMVYVDKGQVHIEADDREMDLSQGEIAFHKPNEFHTIKADGVVAPNVFVISFSTTAAAMSFFKNKHMKVPAKLKNHISSIIKESEETFNFMPVTGARLELKPGAPIGGQQMIRTHLEQFLIMLLRSEQAAPSPRIFPDKESLDNHLVSEIMEIVGKNLDKKISVEEICRKLNYSKTYISRIFKENTGYTIGHYVTELKVKEAKKLIRENIYNFTEISDMLAFDNPHYFSRVFKRVTNMSPLEYKMSVKSRY